MNNWKTIDSAPKDGAMILAWPCWSGERVDAIKIVKALDLVSRAFCHLQDIEDSMAETNP